MTLAERRQQIIDDIQIIEDPEERFGYIVDRGRGLPHLPAELKIDAFKIEGCVSNLWLVPEYVDGRCFFRCDGDSMITKGVGSLICELYSDSTPDEIASEDASFMGALGISQHLTQNRRNGLSNLVKRIREFAASAAAAPAAPTAPARADWGVIFDWDGVVIDSAIQHKLAFERYAAEIGRAGDLQGDWFKSVFGLRNEEIFTRVLGWARTPGETAAMALRKEAIYREILLSTPFDTLVGVRALLHSLHATGVPMAIGSSTPRLNLDTAIKALGLEGLFSAVISGDDVKQGKPNPEVFLKAAAALGLPPARCIVIEDAVYGIEAALAGGMKALAVCHTHPPEKFAKATRCLRDLDGILAPDLKALL